MLVTSVTCSIEACSVGIHMDFLDEISIMIHTKCVLFELGSSTFLALYDLVSVV